MLKRRIHVFKNKSETGANNICGARIYTYRKNQLKISQKKLADRLRSILSISADVRLMEPNSIPRSEGKSVRILDKRHID